MTSTPTRRRNGALLVLTSATLLATAACGSPAASTTAPVSGAAAASRAAGGHSGHSAGMGGTDMGADGAVELWAVQTGPFGVIVTDGAGRMLYRSDTDSATPPTPRCTGPCTTTWAPLRVAGDQPPQLEGVDPAKVGTVPRSDGGAQVTLTGWPLYRSQGEAPGLATAGANGSDGSWFVITPSGGKAAG
ncbi:hypothetical protein [Pseudonocardia sp.]|uniref:hypothetical protein n=1 Tax=Pseudonocardia sp. TaxID=60912 RepID=UPI0026301B89|nr:hypothetical protein [Pseudonocardia sp.]MCW2719398.1 hypothetical protein [Pseudonocardia sp.]